MPVLRCSAVAVLVAIAGSPHPALAQPACDLAPAPNLAADLPDDAFVDANGDGIDGLRCGPIFVSASTGADSNPGTINAPMRTIGGALLAARLYSPMRPVYVANGTYGEQLVIPGGASIYGGYSVPGWARSNVQATVNSPRPLGAIVIGAAQPVLVDRLFVSGNVGTPVGKHSVGMEVRDCAATVRLNRCTVRAQGGAAGATGPDGGPGTPGGAGGNGAPGQSNSSSGGIGGVSGSSAAANPGGARRTGGFGPASGAPGAAGTRGATGGVGGTSGSPPCSAGPRRRGGGGGVWGRGGARGGGGGGGAHRAGGAGLRVRASLRRVERAGRA